MYKVKGLISENFGYKTIKTFWCPVGAVANTWGGVMVLLPPPLSSYQDGKIELSIQTILLFKMCFLCYF